MIKECPRCGQGILLNATIKKLSENVVVCDECEALWTDMTTISSTNFQDMANYLRTRESGDNWSALKIQE